MNEPKFIKSDRYYFDKDNKTIYGRKIYSLGYFHELSHYKDAMNKIHFKIDLTISEFTQMFLFLSCIWLVFSLFVNEFSVGVNILGLLMIPKAIFIFQEEIRAEINSYVWYHHYKKRFDV